MRIAIIGNGSIGQRHARDALSLGHEVLRYDVRRERSDVAEPEELWAWRPDIAVICTPPADHWGWAFSASDEDKGCHLFIEKPLDLKLDYWPEMASYCDRHHIVTHVACPLRYVAEVQAIKQQTAGLQRKRVFAERHYHLPACRPDYREGYYESTGAILDIGSHALDIAQWFLGPADGLQADIRHGGIPDLTCDTGATMFLVHGAAGAILDFGWLTDRPWQVTVVTGPPPGFIWDQHWDWTMGDNIDAAYVAELAAFVEACEGKREPDNPLPEAIGTLRTLLEARAWAQQ